MKRTSFGLFHAYLFFVLKANVYDRYGCFGNCNVYDRYACFGNFDLNSRTKEKHSRPLFSLLPRNDHAKNCSPTLQSHDSKIVFCVSKSNSVHGTRCKIMSNFDWYKIDLKMDQKQAVNRPNVPSISCEPHRMSTKTVA